MLAHRFNIPIIILIIVLLCDSCHRSNPKGKQAAIDSLHKKAIKEWNKTIPGNFSEQTDLHFDSTLLTQFFAKYPEVSTYKKDVTKFYIARNFTYAWFDKNGLIEQAGNLTDRMLNLKDEGINKKLPYSKT